MSLPDLLRARSAQLVGSLELGAPLGRGSFGKVYKGALLPPRAASHMSHTSGKCPVLVPHNLLHIPQACCRPSPPAFHGAVCASALERPPLRLS